MAKRDLQDRNYQSMGDKYKKNNSRDEFKGQKRSQAKSRARKAGDKEAAKAIDVSHTGRVGENSQFYQTNDKGKRQLTDIDKGSNPFKVDNIQDFDTAAYGIGSAKGKEMLNVNDMAGLKKQGGFNRAEIQEYAQGLKDSGTKIGKGAQNKLDKWQARADAKERAQGVIEQQPEPPDFDAPLTTMPVPPPTQEAPTPPKFDGGQRLPYVPPGQSIGGDTGDVGKSGDMTTTVGDIGGDNFGNIGNDYSVTIGNTGNQSGGGGLSNMMGAAAYSALNNNAHAVSGSKINGTTRSASAIAQAEKETGASDRVANLYNMVGQRQNYWKDKATAQQGMYLGDIWNGGGYDWQQAPNPKFTEDRTAEILKA